MEEEASVGSCTACFKWGATQRCSRCKRNAYCNAECQNRDWKSHKKTCSNPDPGKRALETIIRSAVDDAPKLLGLSQLLDPIWMLQPGNQYLQSIIRVACLLNGITEAKNSADIAGVDLRFSYITADPLIYGQPYTILQLQTACPFTEEDMPLLGAPDTKGTRAYADEILHRLLGVRNDPTCCHIPLVFGSGHPTERMAKASNIQFFIAPVHPGVARKAVQEMRDSGKSKDD
ncbi:unnamed protein product [Peniophora sp. CBMAI 1063]|nr:unnamed protein product [Peniophora sp. CBMAI 1063]